MVQGDTHSFIVRIWHEALDREGNIIAWRGSIDHVGGGDRFYFDDLDRLVQFMREQVGLNGQHSQSPVTVGLDPGPV